MSERETALKRILSQLSFMVINAEDRRIVAAEIEALAALPPGDAPQTCAWREIATAPKDGRMILLFPSRCWTDDADHGEVGYWDEDFQEWGGCGSRAEDYTGPSHWMPLPAPPVALVPAE